MALNDRQKRFVAEYLVDLNATNAAIRAGYSPKTAGKLASRLMGNVDITQAIAKATQSLQIRTSITADRVLNDLGVLAFSDVTHYQVDDFGNLVPAPGAPDGVMRAVSSIKRRAILDGKGNVVAREVEFRLWDKPGMLKLAGRHVGLFPSKDHEALKEAAREMLEKRIAETRAARAAAEAQRAVEPVSRVIDVEAGPATKPGGDSDG